MKRKYVYLIILALILIVSCCHKRPVKEPEFYTVNISQGLLPARIEFNGANAIIIGKDMVARVEE